MSSDAGCSNSQSHRSEGVVCRISRTGVVLSRGISLENTLFAFRHNSQTPQIRTDGMIVKLDGWRER